MDHGEVEPAETLDGDIGVDDTVRRVATVDVDPATQADIEARLDAAREAIGRHFHMTIGEREGVNFLRYGVGGFYLPHVDRADVPAWPAAAKRRIAVVLFLNTSTAVPGPDEFTGGELHVIDARVDIEPRAGRLAAFDAGLLHEVLPVRRGTRDVVVDWFY